MAEGSLEIPKFNPRFDCVGELGAVCNIGLGNGKLRDCVSRCEISRKEDSSGARVSGPIGGASMMTNGLRRRIDRNRAARNEVTED